MAVLSLPLQALKCRKQKKPQVRMTGQFAYTFGLVTTDEPNALPVA
jgi:hypothetical protein